MSDQQEPVLCDIWDQLSDCTASIEQHLKCPICLDRMTDAVCNPQCLHRFCGSCVKTSLQKCNNECPTCRVHIPTHRSLRRDQPFEELKNAMCKIIQIVENGKKQPSCPLSYSSTTQKDLAQRLKQMQQGYNKKCVELAESREKLQQAHFMIAQLGGTESYTDEVWDLKHIFTVEQLTSDSPQRCMTQGCSLTACSTYVSSVGKDVWHTCLDCQTTDYGGWPENVNEYPIRYISEDHRMAIGEKCSKLRTPQLPTLPLYPSGRSLSALKNMKAGSRILVQWNIESENKSNGSHKYWWGATVEPHDGQMHTIKIKSTSNAKTKTSSKKAVKKTITLPVRKLYYDIYPEKGFHESTIEPVCFLSDHSLLNLDSDTRALWKMADSEDGGHTLQSPLEVDTTKDKYEDKDVSTTSPTTIATESSSSTTSLTPAADSTVVTRMNSSSTSLSEATKDSTISTAMTQESSISSQESKNSPDESQQKHFPNSTPNVNHDDHVEIICTAITQISEGDDDDDEDQYDLDVPSDSAESVVATSMPIQGSAMKMIPLPPPQAPILDESKISWGGTTANGTRISKRIANRRMITRKNASNNVKIPDVIEEKKSHSPEQKESFEVKTTIDPIAATATAVVVAPSDRKETSLVEIRNTKKRKKRDESTASSKVKPSLSVNSVKKRKKSEKTAMNTKSSSDNQIGVSHNEGNHARTSDDRDNNSSVGKSMSDPTNVLSGIWNLVRKKF